MATVTLERAERFEMRAERTGRSYDISLARPLPLVMTGQVAPDCPIVFVLDSSLTFGTAVERASLSGVMGSLQSAVIVGVGYPGNLLTGVRERTVDFTPKTPPEAHPEMQPMIGSDFGGADEFLDFLINELAPAIRERAPEASSTRLILHGFSLGGLLGAYALLTRPQVFETVTMISPALWWNDFAVLEQLRGFDLRLGASRPRALVGVGAMEQDEPHAAPPGLDLEALRGVVRRARMVDAAREFAAQLASSLNSVEFVAFDGEDHSGAAIAGTGRAVSFALRHV